jgi:uncharacterized DUF497 family protein
LPFSLVAEFDFESALIWQDTRKADPQARFSALGMIGERVYSVVFSAVAGGIRVISFRKANQREVQRYEQASKS